MVNEYQKIITLFDDASDTETKLIQLTKKREGGDTAVSCVDDMWNYIPKQVHLQISGSLTDLTISGKVSAADPLSPLAAINMQTLDTTSSITEPGIYIVPCEGIEALSFTITGAANASVTAKLTF